MPFRIAPVRRTALLCLLLCLLPAMLLAQSAAPRIFFSDLVSGPVTGGEANNGIFLTLYGEHFGAARGSSTVSIGGTPAASYAQWSDTRITLQPGAAARSGPVIVQLAGVPPSNSVPFTVRKGAIYFVALQGKDSANGSAHAPWRTIPHAAATMAPGDTAYVEDGVQQTTLDDYGASLAIARAGKPGLPIALIGYPGARVQVGASSGIEFGLRTPAIHGGPFSHWVVAGITIRGGNEAIGLSDTSDWRIVGNDISCPRGDGNAGCVEAAVSTGIQFFGNTLHDISQPGTSKAYHSLYFTTDSNHIDVGWNVIRNNHSCRGIQFHSSPDGAGSGLNQYDLSVHDNHISGQVCDGINLATIDPAKGAVTAERNWIEHVGRGPDPPDGASSYACIASPGITNQGKPGGGTAVFAQNHLLDCGARGGPDAGAFNIGEGSPHVRLDGNVVEQGAGERVFSPDTVAALVSSSTALPADASAAGPEMRLRALAQALEARARAAFQPATGQP